MLCCSLILAEACFSNVTLQGVSGFEMRSLKSAYYDHSASHRDVMSPQAILHNIFIQQQSANRAKCDAL